MIDNIKKNVALHVPLSSKHGIFFSCFDQTNNLLMSHGVITTDKDLNTVIDMLYHGLIEPQQRDIHLIICDIITTITTQTAMTELSKLNLLQTGICVTTLDHTKSGIVLPATMGISTITDALTYIKQKNNINGNIAIYSFSTQRFSIPTTTL